MKTAVIFVAVMAVAFAIESYPTKYDTIDIDAILANKRLTDNYVACLLKKGKCTEDGAVLKDVIPDALITGCSKCNDHQRASVRKVIQFLVKQRHSDYEALIAVYDPQGKYQQQYQHYLKDL